MQHFIFFICLLLGSAQDHPFKMSVCELDYRHAQDSVEWRIYYFQDDLKEVLYGDPMHEELETSKVEAYSRAHLKISFEGQVIEPSWKGLRERGVQIMAIFSTPPLSPTAAGHWEIENTIMIDHFPSQVNMHYLLLPEDRKEVLMLNASAKNGAIEIKR